jgi:hypothetical protein
MKRDREMVRIARPSFESWPLNTPQLRLDPRPPNTMLRTDFRDPDPSAKISSFNDSEPIIKYNCLLIPVVFMAWWYWTKRKARQVYFNLIRAEPPPDHDSEDDDTYTSWEEVTEKNIPDPSLHFVRWIRGKDSHRRSHSIQLSSLRTMRLASRMSDLSEPLDDDEDSGIYMDPERRKSMYERRSSWHCLQEVNENAGLQICRPPPTASSSTDAPGPPPRTCANIEGPLT